MGSTCGWTRGCILHVHTCTCIRMFTWAVHVDGQEAVYYMSIQLHKLIDTCLPVITAIPPSSLSANTLGEQKSAL